MNEQSRAKTRKPRWHLQLGFVALLAAVCCSLCACGSGNTTVHVKGTATFEGKSIPTGRISFTSESDQPNMKGAQGFAQITNGEFDTRSTGSRGAPVGKVTIRIDGFDGKAVDAEQPSGTALFYPHFVKDEFASGSLITKNLDVPASAKNPPKVSEQPTRVDP